MNILIRASGVYDIAVGGQEGFKTPTSSEAIHLAEDASPVQESQEKRGNHSSHLYSRSYLPAQQLLSHNRTTMTCCTPHSQPQAIPTSHPKQDEEKVM